MAQGHLNGLVDCVTAEVLKKSCENCESWNSEVKSLKELRKVYR